MKESQPWRTFSVFVSSTFADMQAERDHLKHIVFPRVEEELQKRRIKLEMVDLRWGIDTTSIEQEDEREASVLKVCLDEIKRCQPFFIGLLGDRYGWVPPEERMKNALHGEELDWQHKGKSVTALEIEFGVLASKDQLMRSVFYYREPLPYERFPAKRAAMFSDVNNPELSKNEKQERKTALENLKITIKEHFEKKNLSGKVKAYQGIWDDRKETITGLEAWGEMVYEDILDECKTHAEDTWDQIPQNWKEQELALLDGFIEQHTSVFCGRTDLLIDIKEHLLSPKKENWGMVLTGESGSGKSSVFAMVKKAMDKEGCFVLAHSAGLSPRAKNVLDLLQIWNTHLSNRLGIKEEDEDSFKGNENLELKHEGFAQKSVQLEIEKLQEKFRELLFTLAEQQQVVLLVDTLDRFESTERAIFMTWLPTVMPGNIRMLCTAISGTEEKAVQYHNGLFVKSLDYFTQQEASEMLETLCLKQHKTLPEKVTSAILKKQRPDGQAATSSPLWLSLAVNIMMALDQDDFEKMSRLEGRGDQQIESYMANMAEDFAALPGTLFLSLVDKAKMVFGIEFTKTTFNYLACSRNGLREKDLEKLLPDNIWNPLQFAGLRRWFKAHLSMLGENRQWNITHSILHSALIEHILENQFKVLHNNLADHFIKLVDDPLKNTETLYHLLQANELKKAAVYYGGELTEEETNGATAVLAELICTNKNGVSIASSLPALVLDKNELFHGLLKNYIYILNDNYLAVEGNLDVRLALFTNFESELDINVIDYLKFVNDVGVLKRLLGSIHASMGHMIKALKYFIETISLFKEIYAFNPQNESLKESLAILYGDFGSIHQSMGDMKEALKYLEQSNKLGNELYESNPQNENIKENLAILNSKLGSIHQSMGHLDEALKYFEKRSVLVNELYTYNPHNVSFKEGLAKSHENLGSIHQSMGHLEVALKYFEQFHKQINELYTSNPQNESFKENLAKSYSRLGSIYESIGHMEEALKCFEKRSVLAKELYASNPKNESHKKGLSVSYSKLGFLHQSMGHKEETLNYFNKDKKISEELCASNPHNEDLKESLAISYGNLGSIHQSMNQTVKAHIFLGEAIRLLNELYASNPQHESFKNNLANSYSRLGSFHKSMGDMEEALKNFKLYNKLGNELYASNPQKVDLLEDLGISYYKLALVYQELGNDPRGKECFMQWKNIVSHLAKNFPQVSRFQKWVNLKYD